MDKMTFHRKNGRMWLKECDEYEGCDGECWYCESGLIDKIMERLAQYEELGVSPEQIKALIDGKRPETGGTPLMCSGITTRDIALADIRSIEDDNRDAKFNRFKKRIAKMGGYTVFAQMIGTNRATVKQYMNREITPSLDMIVKIAEASTWPVKDCVYLFTGRKVR